MQLRVGVMILVGCAVALPALLVWKSPRERALRENLDACAKQWAPKIDTDQSNAYLREICERSIRNGAKYH